MRYLMSGLVVEVILARSKTLCGTIMMSYDIWKMASPDDSLQPWATTHEANTFLFFIIYPVSGIWLSTDTIWQFSTVRFLIKSCIFLFPLHFTHTHTYTPPTSPHTHHMFRNGNFRVHLRTLSWFCIPHVLLLWLLSWFLISFFKSLQEQGVMAAN
jgi:hypothetical protein